MNSIKILPTLNDTEIQAVATLANEIWHQHFIPIIGEAQVEYMVEKFQSYPAISRQIKDEGYEYYRIFINDTFAGYTGVHAENEALFLSKLYIKKSCRGHRLATHTFHYLIDICKERGLKKIWLTCNKHNDDTLAVYAHLGFKVTDEQVADIGNGFVMDDYILTYEVNN